MHVPSFTMTAYDPFATAVYDAEVAPGMIKPVPQLYHWYVPVPLAVKVAWFIVTDVSTVFIVTSNEQESRFPFPSLKTYLTVVIPAPAEQ